MLTDLNDLFFKSLKLSDGSYIGVEANLWFSQY